MKSDQKHYVFTFPRKVLIPEITSGLLTRSDSDGKDSVLPGSIIGKEVNDVEAVDALGEDACSGRSFDGYSCWFGVCSEPVSARGWNLGVWYRLGHWVGMVLLHAPLARARIFGVCWRFEQRNSGQPLR